MGEAKLNTNIDDLVEAIRPTEIRYIDPMKMPFWSLDRAVEMVGGIISKRHIENWIKEGLLEAYKPGKEVCIEPAKFIVCCKRFRK